MTQTDKLKPMTLESPELLELGVFQTGSTPQLVVEAYQEAGLQQLDAWQVVCPELSEKLEKLPALFLAERPLAKLLLSLGLQHNKPQQLAVDVTFCHNATIKEVNTEYREKPQPTDVLSFPTLESDTLKGVSGWSEAPFLSLGSVLVSVEWACEQTLSVGKTHSELLVFLLERVIHGLLHVSGQHHETDEDFTAVVQHQHRILQALGLPGSTFAHHLTEA